MRMMLLCTLAAVVLPVREGTAQRLEPRALPQRNVESFTLQSPSMGTQYGGARPISRRRVSDLRGGAAGPGYRRVVTTMAPPRAPPP